MVMQNSLILENSIYVFYIAFLTIMFFYYFVWEFHKKGHELAHAKEAIRQNKRVFLVFPCIKGKTRKIIRQDGIEEYHIPNKIYRKYCKFSAAVCFSDNNQRCFLDDDIKISKAGLMFSNIVFVLLFFVIFLISFIFISNKILLSALCGFNVFWYIVFYLCHNTPQRKQLTKFTNALIKAKNSDTKLISTMISDITKIRYAKELNEILNSVNTNNSLMSFDEIQNIFEDIIKTS